MVSASALDLLSKKHPTSLQSIHPNAHLSTIHGLIQSPLKIMAPFP